LDEFSITRYSQGEQRREMQTASHIKFFAAFFITLGMIMSMAWVVMPERKKTTEPLLVLHRADIEPALKPAAAPLVASLQPIRAVPVQKAMTLVRHDSISVLPSAAKPEPAVSEKVLGVIELPELKKQAAVEVMSLPSEYHPFKTNLQEHFRFVGTEGAEVLPAVYLAALTGDVVQLRNLLDTGYSMDVLTPGGDTPLCAAVWNGHAEAVSLLLERGASPHQPGRGAQPPIALASLRRNVDVIEALLQGGADPNTRFTERAPEFLVNAVSIRDLRSSLQNDEGVTPLIACAARGDVEGAATLMRYGAKAGLHTKKNARYPINYAATQGYIFLMRVLLGRPADEEPDLVVTVNLSKQRAWITRAGKVIDSATISSGRKGFATPAGRYVVTDKHKSWTSTIYKVAMPYFMRLNCSAIGMHQGHVTGSPASHGCIRLSAAKARSFFAKVRVGDEVEIVH
jgi:ankyrin repeat protein